MLRERKPSEIQGEMVPAMWESPVLTLSRHREEFVGGCGRQDDGLEGKFRGRSVGSKTRQEIEKTVGSSVGDCES